MFNFVITRERIVNGWCFSLYNDNTVYEKISVYNDGNYTIYYSHKENREIAKISAINFLSITSLVYRLCKEKQDIITIYIARTLGINC